MPQDVKSDKYRGCRLKQFVASIKMKVYEIRAYNKPEGLQVIDCPDPSPRAGQVLVKMRATSLNYRDLLVLSGKYDRDPRPGRVPLSDGAGEVVAVGEGVQQFKPGDRVAGCFFQGWPAGRFQSEMHRTALGGAIDGVLAEQALFAEQGLVHFPPHLSFEEAATLPCAAVTAWQSLIVRGQLAPGEKVLLLGTGGVSIFGLQFAKLAGAKVVLTSSSDAKLERAKTLGADSTINYRNNSEWGKAAAQLSGGGVDHVVEVGAGGTFPQSVRACGPQGKIGLIGTLSGIETPTEIFQIVPKLLTVFGIYVGSKEMFVEMNRAIDQHQIRPVIDRVFPWKEAAEAYAYLKSGAHFGKVVIQVGN
jgi:NADPH:quinone reductase-like Zn-dependent oxidoreductase